MLATRRRPGEVRDAIATALAGSPGGASVSAIARKVQESIGPVPASSIRSYLQLNTPQLFERLHRGTYLLKEPAPAPVDAGSPSKSITSFHYRSCTLIQDDCFDWLQRREENSVHAVITDPPYGLFEYSPEQQAKLRNGKGGVWRIPPAFDGAKRSPLPRFTVLTPSDLRALEEFFVRWARLLSRVLVPGANVLVRYQPAPVLCRVQPSHGRASSGGVKSSGWS